jgi:RNA recognition motif-containing protein
MFEAYGTVERVNTVTDRDSWQPRGFAFVDMSVDGDAERAIRSVER